MERKKKAIFVIGPKGFDKSTQVELMGVYLNAVRIEMSELLRVRGESSEDQLGSYISATIASGELVGSDVVVQTLSECLVATDAHTVIIDGFPRKLEQAQAAIGLIGKGYKVRFIIFDLDDEACIQRIQSGEEDFNTQLRQLRVYREHEQEVRGCLLENVPSLVYFVDGTQSADLVFEDVVQIVRF